MPDWEEISDPKDDDGIRRDQWGRYLVVPPEGGPPVAYRRTTTVTKALDSEGSLVPWAQSRVLRGIVEAPDVLRALRALLKAQGDAWYGTKEAKAEFRQIISRAASAGGAEAKRDRGTWLHGCAERHVLGLPQLDTFTAEDQAWLDRWLVLLHDHGIVIDPGYVEAVVVHDELRIAGKADYLQCRMVGKDLPLVGDLKTGDSLEYALAGYVMQLAIYASADAIYVQGEAADGSQDVRLPKPSVDLSTALVIHAPQGGPEPFSVWEVDVQAGLRAFRLALDVEGWRRTKAAVPIDADLTRQLAESLVVAEAPKVRAWLQERIDAIGAHSELARRFLADLWPEELPTLRASDQHTPAQLRSIEGLCDQVERQFSMPFGPPRPGAPFDALEYLRATFPGSTVLAGSTTREGNG